MDILSVARRAGVSSATVSRALNGSNKVRESTAARVQKAIEDLNYVPNHSARSLRSGRTNLYGIIVSDIRNPFFPDLIEHFESLATQHGIDVTFANTGYSEPRLLASVRRLLERGVDGLAVLTSEVSTTALAKIRESGVSVVFLNQPLVIGNFQNIGIDYDRCFREAVDHLRMLGHKQIAFVAGPPSLSSAVRRRKAFLAAMKSCKLPFRDDWLIEGDHRITGGQFAAERLFSLHPQPTAVVCSNDMTAIGVLQAANRLGRKVPEELSVIGFDDLFLDELIQPALTTLNLSRQEIATRAFFALHAGRGTGANSRTPAIVPQLVIRASTGAAQKKSRN
ncbi:MAG: LacI family DNA-binding transcriptional regulator [Acidobacteriaceae bacterium]|nr:LacI family DNA-binding transcriptional regulator [Acidobacteriaceae bacterium]